jgi:hypothetical protein
LIEKKKLGIGHKKCIVYLSDIFFLINLFKTCRRQEKYMEAYMKKFVILVVAALVAVGSASAASLVVNSTVTQYLNLALTNSSILVTFAGDGTAGTANQTTSLTIKANKVAWTVSFTSTNAGVLTSPTTLMSIPYYLQATGAGVSGATMTNALSSPVKLATPKSISVATLGKTPVNGVSYTLAVTVDAQAGTDTLWQAATDYTDTVTIAISAP